MDNDGRTGADKNLFFDVQVEIFNSTPAVNVVSMLGSIDYV